MPGKKGGQRLSPVPRLCSAQGFAALFAGRVVFSSDSVLPELQSPPNPEVPGPKTSVPPLFVARVSHEELTVAPQGPELAQSQNRSWTTECGLSLEDQPTVAGVMGGKGHGKGHGRGPPQSEEERRRARAAEGLATKSTGSVSRSKARALAHRAAVDLIKGDKAPTRKPVRGKLFQYSGPSEPVVLIKIWAKNGPKLLTARAKGTEKTRTKQGEVLPKDKRALEATSSDYSTESDEGGEVLASSSINPWQRRVRLRTALAAKDKTQDPSPVECAGEEGMAEASEYPTRPSCSQGGGAPTLHGWQQQSRRFPAVVAKVFWAEEIVLVLHGPHTAMRFPMTLLCQEQCTPAVSVLKDRGETFAFRFLCHVACILTWLRYQGYTLLDVGKPTWESRWTPYPPRSLLFDSLTFSLGVRNSVQTESGLDSTSDPNRVFRQVAAECQPWHYRLVIWVESGAMANGSMSLEKVA